jgi:UDP-glucose 4-epimerase
MDRLALFQCRGADPDGQIGEAHDPETHLIPLALASARTGATVRILGDDYETPDGTCILDYIHVGDIAGAHVRALDHLRGGGESCALNLANEHGYSVKEVIEAAETVGGRSIRSEIAPRRAGDPPILIGDASRARALLKWVPGRCNLEVQIQDAWNWITKYGRDY